jgi:16S rRNA processing protein RimM
VRVLIDGDAALQVGAQVRLKHPTASTVHTHIESVRRTHDTYLMHLKGIDSRESAMRWHGARFALHAQDVEPLPEGEFYLYELVGAKVVDANQAALGTVSHVADTGAQQLLVISTGGPISETGGVANSGTISTAKSKTSGAANSDTNGAASSDTSSSASCDSPVIERLLPAVPQFIRHFDRLNHTLEVIVPEGLWDDL